MSNKHRIIALVIVISEKKMYLFVYKHLYVFTTKNILSVCDNVIALEKSRRWLECADLRNLTEVNIFRDVLFKTKKEARGRQKQNAKF